MPDFHLRSGAAACALAFAVAAFAPPAVAAPAAPPARAAQPSAGVPSARAVLAAVRRAVGFEALRRAGGLSLTEVAEGEDARPQTFMAGPRGELRRGDFGYDGRVAWQVDQRRGIAVPSGLRNAEKLSLPLWVRSHWWLDPRTDLQAEVVPAETTADVVAVRLSRKDGVVPATVYVDRDTWLPARLVVPYERGPYTVTYSDYRRIAGVQLPFRTQVAYRDTVAYRTVGARPLAKSEAGFGPPPLPRDHRFDASAPARVETQRGVPFGPNSPGHYYVRVVVDGQDGGWFHFDSGADGMMIDERLADELKMPIIGRTRSIGADGRPREGTFRRGRSFRLGRLTIENPVYLALDMSKNNAPPGAKRAGVVGYDLFARSVVEFSRDGAEITIHDPSTYRLPAGGRWLPLSFMDATPAVPGTVESDRTGMFQVDTGTGGAISLYGPFIKQQNLLEGRKVEEVVSSGAGGEFRTLAGRLRRFEFAGRRFDDVETEFRTTGSGREGGAGVIGRELLAPFVTVFDYPGRRIAFIPLAKEPAR